MIRRLFRLAAILSLAVIVGLSAGCLWSRCRDGAVDVAQFGGWHLWINGEALVVAKFGPESDALQPATLSVDARRVMALFVSYLTAWCVFSLRRRRRHHRGQVRGFPIAPIER